MKRVAGDSNLHKKAPKTVIEPVDPGIHSGYS